jgi:hypothetical protein
MDDSIMQHSNYYNENGDQSYFNWISFGMQRITLLNINQPTMKTEHGFCIVVLPPTLSI